MSRARDLGSSINSTAAGKNLIINGGFDIWQRGTTVSAAGSQFLADRWNTYRGGYASGLTVSRQLVSDSTNLPNLQYCIRMQRDSGNTATNSLGLAYNMESIDSKLHAGKTVTLSFYARAGATYISSGAQIRAVVITGTGTDEAIRNGYTNLTFAGDRYITLTSAWVRYSVVANLGSTITQIALAIDGIIPVGTAGATDYYEITGVQLEAGSSATPFSRSSEDIEGELAKCQRYFYNVNYQDSTRGIYNTVGNGFAQNTTNAYVVIKFPVIMRVGPTLAPFTGPFVLDDGALAYSISNISLNQSGSSSCLINCTTTGMTQYRPVIVYANGSSSARLSFSAEL